ADVFALGGMLCDVLTGKPPHPGESAPEVLTRASAGDLSEAFSRLDRCGADPELVGIARRCLSVNPADRPADAGHVAELIATYWFGVEERLRTAQTERAAAEAGTAEQRKRRKVQAALALAVILFGALSALGIRWAEKTVTEKEAGALQRQVEQERQI